MVNSVEQKENVTFIVMILIIITLIMIIIMIIFIIISIINKSTPIFRAQLVKGKHTLSNFDSAMRNPFQLFLEIHFVHFLKSGSNI